MVERLTNRGLGSGLGEVARAGSSDAAAEQLSARDREILKDVILTYILDAEPVSSRTLSKHQRHGVSAATIRNTMADLEDWGYLSQPHASAGRVPTRRGYHLFIDSLMEAEVVPDRERHLIDANLAGGPPDAEQLMAATANLLSNLSHQVSVVLTPIMRETVLKTIELLPLSGRQVLCVVVSSAGVLENKVIEVDEEIRREDLTWISNYLNDNFAGFTLSQIRRRLLKLMADERAKVDDLLRLSIELADKGLGAEMVPNVVVDGASQILSQPELSDIGRVRQVFETFSRKARLVNILNLCMQGNGVRVLIGEDSDLTSELGFSLITSGYGYGGHRMGTLGVFGPSRMQYPRLIPLVHYLGQALGKVLAERFGPEGIRD